MRTKPCTKCGLTFPLNEFYKHSSGGLQGHCKGCVKARIKIWRQTPRGKESLRKGRKKYAESEHGKGKIATLLNSKAYKEEKKAYDRSPERRAYRQEYNKSIKGRERSKRYNQSPKAKERNRRANTSEKGILRRRKHQQSEKGKQREARYKESGIRQSTLKEYHHSPKGRENLNRGKYKRRGYLSKVENTLTSNQWKEILNKYNGACFYCGAADKKLTRDHITPLSKGGKNIKENVVPACRSCNSKKHNKILIQQRWPFSK